MNVLLVSREYPPFVGGGIGTYARAFARALAASGHRPVVVTVSGQGRELEEREDDVTVVRLPFIAGDDWSAPHPAVDTPARRAAFDTFARVSLFAMVVAEALPRLVERFSIDAIDVPDTGALGWFALNARATGGVGPGPGDPPITTVVHSPTAWIERWNRAPDPGPRVRHLIAMERESARWSDALVGPSAAMARWAEEEWALARGLIEVIPNPLGDLEGVARASASGTNRCVPASPRSVVYVGRLEPRKGVDTLLLGFVAACRDGADLSLDLVGRDTNEPGTSRRFGAGLLETIVPPDLRARVRLHGQIAPEAVARVRATSAAAIVPSPMDNFPYSCVEAMAQGVPVLAAEAGGMAEMLRDGEDGWLFTPGDAPGCAEVLRRVATAAPDRLGAMGVSGARRILDLCGNEAIVRRRVEHLERTIRARRSRGAAPAAVTPVVVINGARAPADSIDRLARAVYAGWDFAHGWTEEGGRVTPFASPSCETLASAGPELGVVVARPGVVAPILGRGTGGRSGSHGPAHCRAPSTRALVRAMVERNHRGAVVPEVVTRADSTPAGRSWLRRALAGVRPRARGPFGAGPGGAPTIIPRP